MKKLMMILSILMSIHVAAQGRQGDGQRGPRSGGPGVNACILEFLATTPMQDLSQDELDGLLRMREEEKLARDVYLYFADLHGTRIFANIARSEQQHMDTVGVLLDRYGITDPIADDTPGQFTSPAFAGLYEELTQRGSVTEVDALLVGATIEDLDIADLIEALEVSDNADIDMVFQNLMKGSRNHLRSFVYLLEQAGETYTAQFLTQAEVDAILNTPMERGIVYDADGEILDGCGNQARSGGRGNRR